MGSDRARVSYDATRRYRAVVAQQGRVALEADANEASAIAGEEMREESLDFVGPSGTPDDGYELTFTTPFDFTVGAGTMYVGGVRSVLRAPVAYGKQAEWVDHSNDPTWVPAGVAAPGGKGNELVFLSLAEAEVSSIEDPALLEVALGGPDTGQRVRLVQRVKRFGTKATTCDGAIDDAKAAWAAEGLRFETSTMRLLSQARLQVSFTSTPSPDPCQPIVPEGCEPDVGGGYLGADNQLIRIQVTAWDQVKGSGRLVWGFDGASFLYRLDVAKQPIVALLSRPPDQAHQPAAGQAVELLRTAVDLGGGAFVASAGGAVAALVDGYSDAGQAVTLAAGAFPPEYADATQTPMAFLRVWQEELIFTRGVPVILNPATRPTGLQVTLTTEDALSPFHPGDSWLVAVRPVTPTLVYPARLLDSPQPPDGPRLWACPLAVVAWGAKGAAGSILADCRNSFDTLVELTARKQGGEGGGGCCEVTLSPADLQHQTLQDVVDGLKDNQQARICLLPGRYALPAPLRLSAVHSNLTIEGCHKGVTIHAHPPTDLEVFAEGLIVMTQADNITLRGLHLELPTVPRTAWPSLLPADKSLAALVLASVGSRTAPGRTISIGIRPVGCAGLTVEDCAFEFPQPAGPVPEPAPTGSIALVEGQGQPATPPVGPARVGGFARALATPLMASGTTVPGKADPGPAPGPTQVPAPSPPSGSGPQAEVARPAMFAVGVFAGGGCAGHTIRGNTFVGPDVPLGPFDCLFGYLLAPSYIPPGETTFSRVLPATLHGSFVGNTFFGLSTAALIVGACGKVDVTNNVVRQSGVGFAFVAPIWLLAHKLFHVSGLTPVTDIEVVVAAISTSPLMMVGGVLARAFVLPAAFPTAGAIAGTGQQATQGQALATENFGMLTNMAKGAAKTPAKPGLPPATGKELAPFVTAHDFMADMERVVFTISVQTGGIPALNFTGNDLQVLTASNTSPRALVVLGAKHQGADLIMANNRLRGSGADPLVVILDVLNGVVSTNVLVNQEGGRSLYLIPAMAAPSAGDTVSVSGNVFRGMVTLPGRKLPSPFDTWHVFNAES